MLGWLLKKINGMCLVYYAHGDGITIQQLVSDSKIDKIKYSFSIMLEKIFLPKTDLIIAVSSDTKSRLLKRVNKNPDKIVVVYNNVIKENSYSTPILTDLKEKGKRIIGYVGGLSSLKGVETLLEAFFLLNKYSDDEVLIFVGDGPLFFDLKKKAVKMNIEEKVVFTGWVKNPLDYIRDFTVLVLPSLYEGCPSVILEAFSLNVPVLGSKVGGIPELLGHDELMFQAMNQDDLASKLNMFLTSKENYALIKRITIDRKKVFTFNHTSLIKQLFLQLLTRTRHGNQV